MGNRERKKYKVMKNILITGGAGFTGDAGTYGNGAVLNTKVDISG